MKKLMVSVVLTVLFVLGCSGDVYEIHCHCGSLDAAPCPPDAGQLDAATVDSATRDTVEAEVDRCAVIGPGSLVRASGPATYYIARDRRRFVFPNETTYFSWYPDFSGICTIPDAQLAAIIIGGNVTIRPGTKLIKITTDPKVYAITPGGIIHWIENEALIASLFGPNWRLRVVDVPDGFFINYTIGRSISTPVHPEGTLITYARLPPRVYIMDGMGRRRTFMGTAFADNGFNELYTVTTVIEYPDGAPVTAREPALSEVIHQP